MQGPVVLTGEMMNQVSACLWHGGSRGEVVDFSS